MNIIALLRWGEAQLKACGIDDPRLDADLLLGRVLDLPRERLYLERDRVIQKNEQEAYQALVTRRKHREPLQYIINEQGFMGLSFYVDQRVLVPRPDTEILAEEFLDRVSKEEAAGQKVLDLCTGSGALAITVAYYRPGLKVTGTDISREALEVARLNSERLNTQIDWRQGDFFEPVQEETWDWILTNPPYVTPEEYRGCSPEIFFEPKQAFLGGEDGLDFYRQLAKEAPAFLKPGGRMLIEIGYLQGKTVSALLQSAGFQTEIIPDLAGRDRVILAR